MKLKSHFYLGACLLRQGALYASTADRAAFLAGCVEPDLNAVTYLKGSLHGQKLRGHNFPNLLPRIQKLIFHLEYSGAKTPVYFYRLGKLTHYLADAFTWPHNTAFRGTLRDHILYEERMENYFLASAPEKIRQAEIIENDRSLFLAILEQHSAYLNAPNGIQTDIDYITRIVALIFTVFSQVIGAELLLLPTGGAV
ncbi:MAG: zinc dependent phospholipase C family protein [Acetatifactor sp.]